MSEPAVAEIECDLGPRRVRLSYAPNLTAAVDVDEQLRATEPPDPPYWMHLWPGAVALARTIAARPELMRSLRVVELGCGLGLPALTAAACGARVVATDRVAAPLRYVQRSARCNHIRLDTVQMDWTALGLCGSFDLCLGADIAYDFGRANVLATALRRLVRPGGLVWLADSVNIHRDDLIDALAAEGFGLTTRQAQEEEEGRPVWVRLLEAQVPA